MAEVQALPSPMIATGGFADWAQTTAGLIISRAVDAEFLRKTTVNADVTSWPGFDDHGTAFTRGQASVGAAAGYSAPLLIGAGILALGLLVFLIKD